MTKIIFKHYIGRRVGIEGHTSECKWPYLCYCYIYPKGFIHPEAILTAPNSNVGDDDGADN